MGLTTGWRDFQSPTYMPPGIFISAGYPQFQEIPQFLSGISIHPPQSNNPFFIGVSPPPFHLLQIHPINLVF